METEKKGNILEGCSSFFLTSSALSCITGWKNRKNLLKNAIADVKYQEELQRQKEIYENLKEAEEWAFKFWLKKQQRNFAKAENLRKLENDLLKADLQMFFKDWPLQIAIEALYVKRKKNMSDFIPMRIVIGRHNKGNISDPLTILYASLVDEIKQILNTLGIDDSYIYRFKENTNICGGATLAYIYSMMSTFPALVILPSIDDRHKKFNILVGIWNQDSLFPFQKKIFSIDYDSNRILVDKEYLKHKMAEIKISYIAISAVINDTYSLIEGNKKLFFPKYAIQNRLSSTYPQIVDFAIREYQSLLDICQDATKKIENTQNAFNMLCCPFEKKYIEKVISKAIETLKS